MIHKMEKSELNAQLVSELPNMHKLHYGIYLSWSTVFEEIPKSMTGIFFWSG